MKKILPGHLFGILYQAIFIFVYIQLALSCHGFETNSQSYL